MLRWRMNVRRVTEVWSLLSAICGILTRHARRQCPGTPRSPGRKVCSFGPIICSRTIAITSTCSKSRVRHVDALSVGLLRARDRSRSGPAEQIRVAARRRRHAGRHALRHPGRQSAASGDRRAGDGGRPDRLALDADRRRQYARNGRPRGGKRGTLCHRRRNLHQFHLAAARRGGDRRRLSAPRLRAAQDREARLCRPWHRQDYRGARQDDRLRREIRAAGAALPRPSGRRGLDRPRDRLDRQQARGACALRGRSDRRRRTAERRVSGPAAAQPAHRGAQAFPELELCPSRAAVRGVSEAGRRTRDLRHGRAARPRHIRATITTISKTSSHRSCATCRIS